MHSHSGANAQFVVHWPPRDTRMIHDRSNKVEADVYYQGRLIVHASVPRPSSGDASTLTLSDLPANYPLNLDIWAEDTTLVDGSGIPLRLSESKPTLELHAGSNNLDFFLVSNTTSLEVSGLPSMPMVVGTEAQLSAVARNAQGAVVLSTPSSFVWDSPDPTKVSVDATGKIKAISNGSVTLKVTESGTDSTNAKSTSLLVSVGSSGSPGQYHIVDLGDLSTVKGSSAAAINDSNVIVGKSYIDNTNMHAFLYNTSMHDLGILFDPAAINAQNIVVGSAVAGNPPNPKPVWYSGGSLSFVPNLPSSISGFATGVNDSGQIAGYYSTLNSTHGFIYDSGSIIDISPPPLFNQVMCRGLSNGGTVVGTVVHIGGGTTAFTYTKGIFNYIPTLGGTNNEGWAINSSGQVAGTSQVPFDQSYHGFFYNGTTAIDMGTLGGSDSYVLAMNDSGVVVGWSWTSNSGHAFVYSTVHGMKDLNQLADATSANITMTNAFGINSGGIIVGIGYDQQGNGRAYAAYPD